jgi:hypothetical protein
MNTLQHLAQSWGNYAKANSLRPGTKKYEQAQHSYFNGAYAAIGCESWPVIIDICLMSGRDILEEAKHAEASSGSDKVLVVSN